MFNQTLHSKEEIAQARQEIWSETAREFREDVVTPGTWESRSLPFEDISMRFFFTKKGNPGPNGYPVYIALHGGGQCPFPDLNDSQWRHQHTYYFNSVADGICVAPRGIRDTWNTHFNEESYFLYDRLLSALSAYEQVDRNRVYLMGFSAGGDGVYGITPYMADCFAAANMSAGHPNKIDLTNLYNMPIQLQVGQKDDAYDRHLVTPSYGEYLDSLNSRYHGGYLHQVYVHYGKPHNFFDNDPQRKPQTVLADPSAWLHNGDERTTTCNTNAVDFVNTYIRNPHPTRVIWNLSMRAAYRTVSSFYWLQADTTICDGLVIASYDKADNSVTVETTDFHGDLTLLFHEVMLDLFRPVTIHTPDETISVTLTPDTNCLQSQSGRLDPNYMFCASYTLHIA